MEQFVRIVREINVSFSIRLNSLKDRIFPPEGKDTGSIPVLNTIIKKRDLYAPVFFAIVLLY